MIDLILVPRGREYQAVCQGLNSCNCDQPLVLPIPLGYQSVCSYLQAHNFEQWQGKSLLIMGLAGSLSPKYEVGDVVLGEASFYHNFANKFDLDLTLSIQERLHNLVPLVKVITSDRIISTVAEKAQLSQKYEADIVDMDGFAILEFCQSWGIKTAMLRVISDNSNCDIPDLSNGINPNGYLDSFGLTISFIQQPIKALTLIKGSLKALGILKKITHTLWTIN